MNENTNNTLGVEQQKRKNIYDLTLVVATVFLAGLTGLMALATYFLYDLGNNDFSSRKQIETYKQTVGLCKEFNDWYTDYRAFDTDTQLAQMRHWVRSEPEWQQLSISMDSTQIIETLKKNNAVIKMFNYFEDAKMLDKKGLLDRDFLKNRFYSLFCRIEKTQNPSFSLFIESYRQNLNDKVWDGYFYCRDTIVVLENDRIFYREILRK
jgi:hypothetical protein